jgi:hypothetical protein
MLTALGLKMNDYRKYINLLAIALLFASISAGACELTANGSNFICDGESRSCRTSPDGSHVACGGESSRCLTSPDGLHVACGGKIYDCKVSSNKLHIACGGWWLYNKELVR